MNKRIYVEKRPAYQAEAEALRSELNQQFNLNIQHLRRLVIYDIFNISADLYPLACTRVFSEVVTDIIHETLDFSSASAIAFEALDGQYDQRSDSAQQCLKLIDVNSSVIVKCGQLVLMDHQTEETLRQVAGYLINPVESQPKDLSILSNQKNVQVLPLEEFTTFLELNAAQLRHFLNDKHFAMSFEDLQVVQAYFQKEGRTPTESELRVLDTYWSDHCRHTTFNTQIQDITIAAGPLEKKIRAALAGVYDDCHRLGRDHKPLTLMELATLNARKARQLNHDTTIEVSDEVNACSIHITVDHDGVTEPWLLMFKNETHNHPTEIEPFGGASTCIGGAIRDPLSGRAYVYQAMRISGCGNVLAPVHETLENKLPQSLIAKRATAGNSSYGNQIGLTTTYVKEIYHPSYQAKHLECGAVVGAVKASDVRRETPCPGDVIILLGGRTGRDGIGGATGSSMAHQKQSLTQSAAEVQKGNAPEERKIQRLFRNPQVTALIKRCNDFGAGGVSVAIGELADGLDIDLDQVRLKYEGLNATEIAISESQERMAVVLDPHDVAAFIQFAYDENLEAYAVAKVCDHHRLRMTYHGEMVVDLDRDFLNSAGAVQTTAVYINPRLAPSTVAVALTKQNLLDQLRDLRFNSQKGLIERFDGSIGATTVLNPLAGKNQLTPNDAAVQKLPLLDGKTDTCSVLSYGFSPLVAERSPYLLGEYAVLDSVAKSVAVGADPSTIYLSLQEYFGRMRDETRWGDVTQALLGAISAQNGLGLAAIGGKDSMSGSYENLDVVDTLISFACSPQSTQTIISQALKEPGHYLYFLDVARDANDCVDFAVMKIQYQRVHKLIKEKVIVSAKASDEANILVQTMIMSLGNEIGFDLQGDVKLLSQHIPGGLILEAVAPLDDFIAIGRTTAAAPIINGIRLDFADMSAAYTGTLSQLYPISVCEDRTPLSIHDYAQRVAAGAGREDRVKVAVLVFPGTNCEYDVQRAFREAGAEVQQIVFNNLDGATIQASLIRMAQAIRTAQIIALPGGFSSGDEPDGSAKFIVNVLKNERIRAAIIDHLAQKRLIIGICNGFQALVKSGLIPYGEIRDLNEKDLSLYRNDLNRHSATMVHTRVSSVLSPWLASSQIGQVHGLPVSHGEGKLIGDADLIAQCQAQGCICFQYCDEQGVSSMASAINPNGSYWAIEGMTSYDGLVLGKMGHSERIGTNTYVDQELAMQAIFRDGVAYFKKGDRR